MVECADGKSDSIYKALKETFQEHHIPIIGFSSDTTNVMFGGWHSVSQLLRSKFPHVFTGGATAKGQGRMPKISRGKGKSRKF